MKGDWLVILILVIAFGLFTEAAGAPILLGSLTIIAGWLRAIPEPTEHWASMVGAFAWPLALVVIFWWLRAPIADAANKLAGRFATDDVEVGGGWLKVSSKPVIALDSEAAAEEPGGPEAANAKHVEGLLEYAAESERNVDAVFAWVERNVGTATDIEDFLYDDTFADQRKRAYDELVGKG